MKKYLYFLLAVIITMPVFSTTVFANDKKPGRINESSIILDGQEIWITGFNVGGNNYFKLRNIAANLSDTTSRFEVTWNNEKKLIEIITGASYTPVEEKNSQWYYKNKNYFGRVKNTEFLVDGKTHNLPVYYIDGSNYFKIRDLSELVGFEMVWNKDMGQIVLASKLPQNAYRGGAGYDGMDNMLYPSYPRWKDPNISYLTRNQDGTISVIEANKNVRIDTYDENYHLIRSNHIDYELPIFGAFYSGEEYNYIAFGQLNKEEDNNKEVIRLVRYDKAFNRIDSVSVKGGESFTIEPFTAGGRIAEHGGQLIFHTSRTRYTTSDGLNHQSQLTLIIDPSRMKVLNDLGQFQSNHVSHSFDQYVLFDNNTHVLVDHGDAYPRSVVLSKESGSGYNQVDLFKIPGAIGANCTGVSIGGFEASTSNYIVAMNTIDHSLVTEYTSYEMVGLKRDQRDVIIATVPKDNLSSNAVKHITLKKYIGTNQNASIPQLVKISDDKFMVMWQEYNDFDKEGDLNYLLIDGQGNPTTDIKKLKGFRLSSAQAVLVDGKVVWHYNKKGIRTFYTIPL